MNNEQLIMNNEQSQLFIINYQLLIIIPAFVENHFV